MPASPISYALPTHENLDPDEDWSRISDRKMKKRLQNRVAQREYRRRLPPASTSSLFPLAQASV